MGAKTFTTEKGKMEILRYERHNPPKKGFNSYLGVQLIAYFEGSSHLGQDGDRITFIQLVKDTFYGKKNGDENRYYTWKLNKEAVFTEGDMCRDELDWTIDQIRRDCGNTDFRYTERRLGEDVPMSSQQIKTEALLGMSEQELLDNGFGMLRGRTAEQKRAYIEAHMFSETDPLPHIVFSAEKKDGRWERARMADTPCAPCDERREHEGGQEFQIAVLYENGRGEKEIIGTLFWGWTYNRKENRADLPEPRFLPGCTEELGRAVEAWNAREGYMKIEGLR